MARELDSFEDARKSLRRAERKYPWSQWANGKPWEVVHGTDFECGPDSFVAILRAKARTLTMKVRIRRGFDDNDTAVIAFQFFKPTSDEGESQ